MCDKTNKLGCGEENWLALQMKDVEFAKRFAQEEVIENFLNDIDAFLQKNNISRAELARRMGCKPEKITRIMRRTRTLTVETMVEMVHALGLQLEISVHGPSKTERKDN